MRPYLLAGCTALAACLAAASPAHATRCEVGTDADVVTGVIDVHVHVWTDPGVQSGTYAEESVVVTVAGHPVRTDGSDYRSPGAGLVEQATGVNPYSTLCP
jgi:predicted amidohydrolase